ncbi:hypothetical protein GGX14DRAFT_387645 [Mycena pura]|uniref:Uncharacterized protein n=1 Tax=Mycena pura TaxID=153505 RepID=A0AAD6YMA6_9AGAR|nr:hypothetical protein GGX14DRAFT_387645 [Mycena pura]
MPYACCPRPTPAAAAHCVPASPPPAARCLLLPAGRAAGGRNKKWRAGGRGCSMAAEGGRQRARAAGGRGGPAGRRAEQEVGSGRRAVGGRRLAGGSMRGGGQRNRRQTKGWAHRVRANAKYTRGHSGDHVVTYRRLAAVALICHAACHFGRDLCQKSEVGNEVGDGVGTK